MYDRVLVITINSYYSKVPSTGTSVQFYQGTEYRNRGTFKKYRAHPCICGNSLLKIVENVML